MTELADEVHLYYLPTTALREEVLWSKSREWLSAEEQRRGTRLAFDHDRRAYLTAHLLLRGALSRYGPLAPGDWKFTHSLHGKPALLQEEERAPLHFNLSHTAGLVACAITQAGEVGVDVETVRPGINLDIARRFFAPEEFDQLEQAPTEQRADTFFRFWTLKEAYLKARGLGLSVDLAAFAFPDVLGEPLRITFAEGFADDPSGWQFFRHEPDPEHKIAVALHRPFTQAIRLITFPNVVFW